MRAQRESEITKEEEENRGMAVKEKRTAYNSVISMLTMGRGEIALKERAEKKYCISHMIGKILNHQCKCAK